MAQVVLVTLTAYPIQLLPSRFAMNPDQQYSLTYSSYTSGSGYADHALVVGTSSNTAYSYGRVITNLFGTLSGLNLLVAKGNRGN